MSRIWTETTLLEALRNGDRITRDAALRHLFVDDRRPLSVIRSQIKNYGGSEADVQSVFFEAVADFERNVHRGLFQKGSSLLTYFHRIAKHKGIDWLDRKVKNRHSSLPEGYGYDLPDTHADDVEKRRRQDEFLNRQIERMEPDCRVVILDLWDGLVMRDIAGHLGIDNDVYARKKKHKCIKKFRLLIESSPELQQLFNFRPSNKS